MAVKLTPYYNRNGVTIYCGDCLEVMPQLKPSVDAIIADWPYGTTACEWDSIIPLDPLWKECKRLIKSNGAVVLTASQPFASILIMSNLKWFKDEWIWRKDRATRHLDCEIRPMKNHENILIFGKQLPNYNPQKTQGKKPAAKSGQQNGKIDLLMTGKVYRSENYGQTDRYPVTVLDINVPNHGEMGFHPTQKPVALMSYLICTYTNPGELILDNTMGSGTTLVAAKNTGRRAIGIDIDEHWCKVAVDRLTNTKYISLPNGNGKLKVEQLELIA